MSLMGYTEADVMSMRESIDRAHKFILTYPSALMDKAWLKDLHEASEFLEGLLIEGRVE